jgi:hypothetical protein
MNRSIGTEKKRRTSLAIGRGVEEVIEEPIVPNKLLSNDIKYQQCLAFKVAS